jgi:hypothetical protein
MAGILMGDNRERFYGAQDLGEKRLPVEQFHMSHSLTSQSKLTAICFCVISEILEPHTDRLIANFEGRKESNHAAACGCFKD